MSITKKVPFEKRVVELESFIKENNKKPTAKTNKSLKIWLDSQVKESNKYLSKRDTVRGLLKKHNLLGRVGECVSDWNHIYLLLSKYIEDNKTDKMTEKESQDAFGLNIKNWLRESRVIPERRLMLEKIYQKNNLPLIQVVLIDIEKFKNVFNFSYEYKINTNTLSSLNTCTECYGKQFINTKKLYKKGTLTKKMKKANLDNKFKKVFADDFYFEAEQLKIFRSLNTDLDLEMFSKKHSPCLIIKKELGSEKVLYEVSSVKTPSTKTTNNDVDIKKCQFQLCIDIKKTLQKLRDNAEKLSENSLIILKSYENINLDLVCREFKLKEAILENLGKPFYFNDYKDMAEKTWKESVVKYQKNGKHTKSSKNIIIAKALRNNTKQLKVIAIKLGLSTERVRQVFEDILKIFKDEVENNLSNIAKNNERSSIFPDLH